MTKSTQQVKEDFLYPTPPLNPDSEKSFLEITQTNNLNIFATHLQYISSMVIGGRLSVEDSYKEVKRLYKSWKNSHKSLKGGWFN